jgi:hypothetical protein
MFSLQNSITKRLLLKAVLCLILETFKDFASITIRRKPYKRDHQTGAGVEVYESKGLQQPQAGFACTRTSFVKMETHFLGE